jgi:hypothetical protein
VHECLDGGDDGGDETDVVEGQGTVRRERGRRGGVLNK